MKKIQSASFAVALMFVAGSSAHAAIQIHVAAEVRNGMVFIKGKGAARGAPITWEGGLVATANNGNGSFSFFGELPDDCTGALSDGNETVSVEVRDCTSVIAGAIAPAPLPRTGQIVSEVPGDDGALQKGVPLPSPRFTPSHGTLSDNLTGLVWLSDLRCPALSQQIGWASAMTLRAISPAACAGFPMEASLATGACRIVTSSRACWIWGAGIRPWQPPNFFLGSRWASTGRLPIFPRRVRGRCGSWISSTARSPWASKAISDLPFSCATVPRMRASADTAWQVRHDPSVHADRARSPP